uniref:Mediator of RNA polymerase II transcription subunit 19 n=1 Tax=Acrobeloides nanus TaxID=290746 RepID=A0A914CB02_9BILA
MSSGSLRTKISLKGGYSQLSLVCPFYGMKQELPPESPLLGSDDLMSRVDLSGAYSKYCSSRRIKEDLASFLPNLCGTANLCKTDDPSCSLRNLVERPPITGKEITSLSSSSMVGFKLAPGPVPDHYRMFDQVRDQLEEPMQVDAPESSYQEFGKNFDDSEETKAKHRKKYKRSLEDFEDNDRKYKKHRGEEKEKKPKKKKKEKKKKKSLPDEDVRRAYRKDSGTTPFF